MTPPTDSLEDALLQVPWVHAPICNPLAHRNYMGDGAWCIPVPDGPALAAAARKWMRQHFPTPMHSDQGTESLAYNNALETVARALGLEP